MPLFGGLQFISPRSAAKATHGQLNMPMGQQDLLDLDADLVDTAQDRIQLPARINHSTFHGLRIPQQGAILLERGHWNYGRLQTSRLFFIGH